LAGRGYLNKISRNSLISMATIKHDNWIDETWQLLVIIVYLEAGNVLR